MAVDTNATTITAEELQGLQEVQKRTNALVNELGNVAIARLQLEQREDAAEKFLAETQALEIQIAKELEDKYGKVSVNVETGAITRA